MTTCTSSSRACNHNKNLSSDDDDDDDDDTRAATFAACGLGSVRHTIAYQVGIIAAYYMYSVRSKTKSEINAQLPTPSQSMFALAPDDAD